MNSLQEFCALTTPTRVLLIGVSVHTLGWILSWCKLVSDCNETMFYNWKLCGAQGCSRYCSTFNLLPLRRSAHPHLFYEAFGRHTAYCSEDHCLVRNCYFSWGAIWSSTTVFASSGLMGCLWNPSADSSQDWGLVIKHCLYSALQIYVCV